ncbi:Piso0_003890 [Millerozyma farinosa CBS 7064]|uniref:Piso0_003890 protein n=1 Tax=Pichia sorbitophila (strain ATCC MYA-4447 / BCRC 22081 / CBS 7064 / NBRC 10061 / NRRL Y-12695) TaxID=559304 RepID=G8Y6W6_PICSO|nr:Piso0_003890 [Millerozyma farinosa CBS 7064]CCE84346.1 Piso0_003890 [Millerozyma farinosa CBS 7064]
MDHYATRIQNIRHDILETTTKAGLDDIKRETEALERALAEHVSDSKSVGYERRRINEDMALLYRLIGAKYSTFAEQRFHFSGKPVPRALSQTDPDHHHGSTTSQSARGNSRRPGQAAKAPDRSPAPSAVSGLCRKKATLHPTAPHTEIAAVEDSVVVFGSPSSSIHGHNIRHSVLIAQCHGPVFLHDVCDAVIEVKCHQLRCRGLKRTTIRAQVSSGVVVIEECSQLRIATPPSSDAGVDTGVDTSVHVDDFSWPTRDSPSPHFAYINHTQFPSLDWARSAADGPIAYPSPFP